MSDIDCPAGARCVSDATGTGCRDAFMMRCAYNSDCGNVLVCAPDGVCREQCHTDRDCRDGLLCDRSMSPTVCVRTLPDAGPGTDASMDSGTPPTDSGVDVGLDAAASVDANFDANVDAAVVAAFPAAIPHAVGGSDHVCATRASDGELRCWGSNTFGQLGDSTVMPRNVATLVTPSIANVTMLAAGISHSCAYSTTAGLQCWGDGTAGQLGDGSSSPRDFPGPVAGGLAPAWISAGHAHTCAVIGTSVQCWGANASGQLGDGGYAPHGMPMPAVALAGPVAEVVARADWTCARLMDGRAQCWGDDRSGQLGVDIPATMSSPTPLFIGGVSNAVELTLGSNHGCARDAAGVVSCWGLTALGQLGEGTMAPGVHYSASPTSPMPPARQIVAFGDHTCALSVAGDVYCWGDNSVGQCGRDGFVSFTLPTPSLVPGVSGATEIATGDNHTCARVAAGFTCWGLNTSGELGDGTNTSRFAPGPTVVWM